MTKKQPSLDEVIDDLMEKIKKLEEERIAHGRMRSHLISVMEAASDHAMIAGITRACAIYHESMGHVGTADYCEADAVRSDWRAANPESSKARCAAIMASLRARAALALGVSVDNLELESTRQENIKTIELLQRSNTDIEKTLSTESIQ